jgi:hypothetical protein
MAGLPHGQYDLFHKLRRTNATAVCEAAGEEATMRQLGHSSMSVTRRYIDTSKLSAPRIVDSMRRPEWHFTGTEFEQRAALITEIAATQRRLEGP